MTRIHQYLFLFQVAASIACGTSGHVGDEGERERADDLGTLVYPLFLPFYWTFVEEPAAAAKSLHEFSYVRPVDGVLTQAFGVQNDAYWRGYHAGVDFGVPVGTPVRAVADGEVRVVQPDPDSSHGNMVVIYHGSGLATWYSHLDQFCHVRILIGRKQNDTDCGRGDALHAGQKVRGGDVIALSGNTGFSTGPHLHFELHHHPALDGVVMDEEGALFGEDGALLGDLSLDTDADLHDPLDYLPQ